MPSISSSSPLVIVVRHGERADYDENNKQLQEGDPAAFSSSVEGDPGLTETGRKAVGKLAAKLLEHLLLPYCRDDEGKAKGKVGEANVHIIASCFKRTMETAEELRVALQQRLQQQKGDNGQQLLRPLVVDNELCEVFNSRVLKVPQPPLASLLAHGHHHQQQQQQQQGLYDDETNKAASSPVVAVGSVVGSLPQWEESAAAAYQRYFSRFVHYCQLAAASSASTPTANIGDCYILVTHGDAHSAIVSRLFPARVVYEVCFLGTIAFRVDKINNNNNKSSVLASTTQVELVWRDGVAWLEEDDGRGGGGSGNVVELPSPRSILKGGEGSSARGMKKRSSPTGQQRTKLQIIPNAGGGAASTTVVDVGAVDDADLMPARRNRFARGGIAVGGAPLALRVGPYRAELVPLLLRLLAVVPQLAMTTVAPTARCGFLYFCSVMAVEVAAAWALPLLASTAPSSPTALLLPASPLTGAGAPTPLRKFAVAVDSHWPAKTAVKFACITLLFFLVAIPVVWLLGGSAAGSEVGAAWASLLTTGGGLFLLVLYLAVDAARERVEISTAAVATAAVISTAGGQGGGGSTDPPQGDLV